LIAQTDPADKLAGQLFVCAKSPVVWMLLILSVVSPLLVSVIVWAALEVPTGTLVNERLEGLSVTAAPKALPLRLMVWGDPAASS
jgi:hypothetical protein